ncbi:glycosyltransferase family 39 protein [Thiobacillus sp.]
MKTRLDCLSAYRTLLYILAFSFVWWGIFTFSRHYLDGADMVENYAWGMEWQWGTNKHPPLFGWITAAWFRMFAVSDGAYYLLNQVNLAVALGLLALAMKRIHHWDKVLAAVVLTALGTHYRIRWRHIPPALRHELLLVRSSTWPVWLRFRRA